MGLPVGERCEVAARNPTVEIGLVGEPQDARGDSPARDQEEQKRRRIVVSRQRSADSPLEIGKFLEDQLAPPPPPGCRHGQGNQDCGEHRWAAEARQTGCEPAGDREHDEPEEPAVEDPLLELQLEITVVTETRSDDDTGQKENQN